MNLSKHKISIILILLAVIGSCSFNKHNTNTDFILQTEFAFLEYYQTQVGEVISGTVPQGRRIDGPTYRFEKDTKKLDLYRNVNFSIDSVKVILGYGKILKGASGSGLSKRINTINTLPYSFNNLTIAEVSSNGIHLVFDSKELLLKEGEEWQNSTMSIDTIKTELVAIVKTTTTYSLRYFGKLDKKNISQ